MKTVRITYFYVFVCFGKIHNILRRKMHAQFLMVINSEESDENGDRKKTGTAASARIKNAREEKLKNKTF